jgi:hypothetical protein
MMPPTTDINPEMPKYTPLNRPIELREPELEHEVIEDGGHHLRGHVGEEAREPVR